MNQIMPEGKKLVFFGNMSPPEDNPIVDLLYLLFYLLLGIIDGGDSFPAQIFELRSQLCVSCVLVVLGSCK